MVRCSGGPTSAGDRSATRDFLTETKGVSRFVTLDRAHAWANFSPPNVSLHGVSAAVAFGDAGLALEAARPLRDRLTEETPLGRLGVPRD